MRQYLLNKSRTLPDIKASRQNPQIPHSVVHYSYTMVYGTTSFESCSVSLFCRVRDKSQSLAHSQQVLHQMKARLQCLGVHIHAPLVQMRVSRTSCNEYTIPRFCLFLSSARKHSVPVPQLRTSDDTANIPVACMLNAFLGLTRRL